MTLDITRIPKDIWLGIFILLNEHDLVHIKRVNKLFYSYVSHIYNNINIDINDIRVILENSQYLRLQKYIQLYNNNKYFKKNAKRKHILKLGNNLEYACKSGDTNLVYFIIRIGVKNWNDGLLSACYAGNIEIVNLMILKGANYWNGGLIYACKGNNIEIVNLMIDKGANDWNGGLLHACCCGNIEIFNLMIHKGANNWNGGLFIACFYGNIKIVKLLIYHGAKRCDNCNNSKHPELQ